MFVYSRSSRFIRLISILISTVTSTVTNTDPLTSTMTSTLPTHSSAPLSPLCLSVHREVDEVHPEVRRE